MDSSLIFGDWSEQIRLIPDQSVNMVLADLPYGTTNLSWDRAKYRTGVIDLVDFWNQARRVLAPNGMVVLTANQPFTSLLVTSNLPWFKQSLVWAKNRATGHMNCKHRPMNAHEDILIFAGQGSSTYNPQMTPGEKYIEVRSGKRAKVGRHIAGDIENVPDTRITVNDGERYPQSVLSIPVESHNASIHPTQKPLALFEWLVKTYSNPGDTVLDPTAGSMTTAVAAIKSGRRYYCIENNQGYFEQGEKRVRLALTGEFDFRRVLENDKN
jgi:site-specific DNA-methyltransferase (adenine-specific)